MDTCVTSQKIRGRCFKGTVLDLTIVRLHRSKSAEYMFSDVVKEILLTLVYSTFLITDKFYVVRFLAEN